MKDYEIHRYWGQIKIMHQSSENPAFAPAKEATAQYAKWRTNN